MYKDWLRKECNIKLRDYKKLSDEEKSELYTDWLSTIKEAPTCPCCGTEMLCGYPAWDGRTSAVDYSMALIAKPVSVGLVKKKEVKVIAPMIHVCMNCGFTGLFMSKAERKVFEDVCCDVDYHI